MAEINTEKKQKRERTFVYSKGCILVRAIFHTLLPVKYHNPTGMDREGPYMLLANHQSWIDPVIIAVGCRAHEIRFVGKKELTKNKALAWLVTKLHMITVDRHNTDLQAMRQCNQVLREGKVLGIFPEGTRHLPDMMSEVETGAAVLAFRSKALVLPVYIQNKLKLFRRTHVYVGDPMPLSDLYEQGMNADTIQEMCSRIQHTFWDMRKEYQFTARKQKKK
ncbi:MAG: 1-acyl-sn-glycerol-3-phosphate acyltransferase [Clostridia bacterium]|nr:1-acyl-sn-glycerol-3-phosphate acyltransferase [Clostridia bacterium]